jgi:hypothetical protein
MGRLEKLKRQLIEEANKRVLKENTIEGVEYDISDTYSEYGTNITTIANKFSGGGYQWGGVSGVCIPLYHNGKVIRSYDEGGPSHCCGYTLSIAFIAATNRGLFDDKSQSEVSKFSSDWYSAGGVNGKLCVIALENTNIGSEVSLEDAIEGDFCQIWRTNGSGHSVIFLSHIYGDSNEIIGINYRSSQKSTDGIGDTGEYFSDSGSGKMDKQYTYFGRMNP